MPAAGCGPIGRTDGSDRGRGTPPARPQLLHSDCREKGPGDRGTARNLQRDSREPVECRLGQAFELGLSHLFDKSGFSRSEYVKQVPLFPLYSIRSTIFCLVLILISQDSLDVLVS